jgi:hypothetical protein
VDELESFVPIRSINKDRGNLSKKELDFLKSKKKSTRENVQIPNKKIQVKDIFYPETDIFVSFFLFVISNSYL